MDSEKHVPTCLHCGSTQANDLQQYSRTIGQGMWQGGGNVELKIPRVSFNCGACGERNEYDVPTA